MKHDPQKFYDEAARLIHAGKVEDGEQAFAAALTHFPEVFYESTALSQFQGSELDSPVTRAFFKTLSTRNNFLQVLLQDCPLLGGTGETLRPEQEEVIEDILAEYRDLFEDGDISPSKTDIYNTTGPVHTPTRATILCAKYISLSPKFIENDITLQLGRTLPKVCPKTEIYYGESLLYNPNSFSHFNRSADEIRTALSDLDTYLSEAKPEFVIMEGNFIGCDLSIQCEDIVRLKEAHGFKLVVLIPDLYPPMDNFAAYWAPVSDLVISYCAGEHLTEAAKYGKVIDFPSLPFDPDYFATEPPLERNVDIAYAGTRARLRDMFCAHLDIPGITTEAKFTDRLVEHALSWPEYFAFFQQARMTLNSGLSPSGSSILTGRIFEAVLSKSVLLQQETPALRDYLVPYVHYIPFTNVHQMVAFARYFIKHEDVRAQMAEEAHAYVTTHYSPERHWKRVFSELW